MKKSTSTPYITGGLTGILMVISAVISKKFFGTSYAVTKMGAAVEIFLFPEHAAHNSFIQSLSRPFIDWQLVFVIGILIGAACMSLMTKSFKKEAVPPLWEKRFGPSVSKRALVAFIGGFLAIIGAKMAGGCPSGHGLTGVSILSVASFVTLACFCFSGVITAHLLYGRRK